MIKKKVFHNGYRYYVALKTHYAHYRCHATILERSITLGKKCTATSILPCCYYIRLSALQTMKQKTILIHNIQEIIFRIIDFIKFSIQLARIWRKQQKSQLGFFSVSHVKLVRCIQIPFFLPQLMEARVS